MKVENTVSWNIKPIIFYENVDRCKGTRLSAMIWVEITHLPKQNNCLRSSFLLNII